MKTKLYKIDLAYPFFFAMVISAFICAFALSPWFSVRLNHHNDQNVVSGSNSPVSALQFGEISPGKAAGKANETADALPDLAVLPSPAQACSSQLPDIHISMAVLNLPGEQDEILAAYRDPAIRDQVTAFFSRIIHSPEYAQAVLSNADVFDISPGLAFALCWEESRFNVHAVNRKNANGSTDRGLFQLNDYSFPHLSEKEFFDPRINSHYGLSHLRWCLNTGGSLVAGLAMYNAGTNRVSSGGTPKRTLDYVSSILESKRRIENLFEEHRPIFPELAQVIQEEEPEPEKPALPRKPRLSLLSPAR
jgi:hypothetical protein